MASEDFPGARDPRHRGHSADRDADAHALQVVLAGVHDLDEASGHPPTMAQDVAEGKREGHSEVPRSTKRREFSDLPAKNP